ncbi:MAG TPA: hypothetical protein DCR14_19395 [Acidimicrobiaceae bacterium]|nr:hypothetical protein [Acidimicrobiaceae bacterium]
MVDGAANALGVLLTRRYSAANTDREGEGVAFKREWVDEWVTKVAPGERLLSYVVAAMWTPIVVKETHGGNSWHDGPRATSLRIEGDAAMDRLIAELVADPTKRVAPSATGVFYALTTNRLLLGSRSSLRNRPNDLLHQAPATAATVYWFDHEETAGNAFRHLLVDFGDGRWRRDRSGLTALGKDLRATSNVDEFFAAMGTRAHQASPSV